VSQAEAARALQDLRQLLEFARELARRFPSAQVMDLIRKAELHEKQARRALQVGRPREVFREVEIARKYLDAALRILMRGPVEGLFRDLSDLIRQVERALQRSFNAEAHRLLQKAKENRELALMAFRQGQFRKALEFYRVAKFQAQKSLGLLEREVAAPGPVSPVVGVQQEEQRFRELLRKTREMVEPSQSREAQKLLNQALIQAERAEQAKGKRRFGEALQRYQWATRLLIRAIDWVRQSPQGERLVFEAEKRFFQELLRVTRDKLQGATSPPAQRFLDQAIQISQEADELWASGESKLAIARLNLAERLLRRAIRLAKGLEEPPGLKFEGELRSLRQILRSLDRSLSEHPNPQLSVLLEKARRHLRNARQFWQQGKRKRAYGHLWLTTSLAFLIRDRLQSPRPGIPPEQDLRDSLERLRQGIEGLSLSARTLPEKRFFLRQAQKFYNDAEQALQKKRYLVAEVCIRAGLEILQRLEGAPE